LEGRIRTILFLPTKIVAPGVFAVSHTIEANQPAISSDGLNHFHETLVDFGALLKASKMHQVTNIALIGLATGLLVPSFPGCPLALWRTVVSSLTASTRVEVHCTKIY
jgi:hypothetical protein